LSARAILPIKAPPQVDVDLRHRIGTLNVDVRFSLTQPWTILFGPSGSGKTTILRAIAGLVHPTSAKIVTTVVDFQGQEQNRWLIDTQEWHFVECHKRHIPLAAQRASLFPHMTVRQQIGYGMRLMAKNPDDEDSELESCDEKTQEIFSLFRIVHLADKLPRALSGGEAQCVSMARAAASASRLLLLDEPFSGLDMALASEIMQDLQPWAAKRNLCVLSVTHDVAEAFQLGAEVIKLAEGRVMEQGPVEVVLAEERAGLLQQLNGVAGSQA
jgi:molybdate transport system ATP-binding protein